VPNCIKLFTAIRNTIAICVIDIALAVAIQVDTALLLFFFLSEVADAVAVVVPAELFLDLREDPHGAPIGLQLRCIVLSEAIGNTIAIFIIDVALAVAI